MRFIILASVVAATLASDTRLEYEGISAATTLADLEARFPERIDMSSEPDPAGPERPITASVRFEPWLGRSHFMDYFEIANVTRLIRLFFVEPGAPHPQNERPLRCNVLLDELRARHGQEERTEGYNEEAMQHSRYIWTRANATMTLDCGFVGNEPKTVDRLFFECRGTCR